MSKLRALSLIIFLFSLHTIHSQNFFLDSLVVTASRIPSTLAQSSKDVQVINAQQIKSSTATSVSDLLKNIAGVNLNNRGGFGVQTDIGIRGSTYSQVLILIDNVRFNDPLTGHYNGNFPIPLSEIAQIEIIRGASAISYGVDAVGGIIHIKTKTYLALGSSKNKTLSGEISAGSHENINADISMFSSSKKLTMSAAVRTNISAGETLDNPNYGYGFTEDSTYNNFFNINMMSLAGKYRFNDNFSIYARAGLDVRKFAAKYFYTQSVADESIEHIKNKYLISSLRANKGRWISELNLGFKQLYDEFTFNPAFPSNEHTTNLSTMNLNQIYIANNHVSISVGFNVSSSSIKSTDRGDHDKNTWAAYTLLKYMVNDDFTIDLGQRLEYDKIFNIEYLPQVSLSYRKDKWHYWTGVSKGIRAADFTERYVSHNIPLLTPGRNIGNPDLLPESSWSYELGIKNNFSDRFAWGATLFYRDSKNLIDFDNTNSNDIKNAENLEENQNYYYSKNIADAKTQGIEFFANHFLVNSQNLKFQNRLAYTYIHTKASSTSKYLANHPKHNVSLISTLDYGHWSINLEQQYITRQTDKLESLGFYIKPSYWLADIKISHQISANGMRIFGKISNLGNQKYEEILGAVMPRRWFFIGISMD
ncbi:MAG: TonB-dependent receptor [Saprospiraceae bacterium]|nr:TonB-dependent receptor [Saprospiraceae bacterium]